MKSHLFDATVRMHRLRNLCVVFVKGDWIVTSFAATISFSEELEHESAVTV